VQLKSIFLEHGQQTVGSPAGRLQRGQQDIGIEDNIYRHFGIVFDTTNIVKQTVAVNGEFCPKSKAMPAPM
jgi:hypothetical protein